MITHSAVTLIAGDDWEIAGTLLDETGAPYDLSVGTLLWTLLNDRFEAVIEPADVVITITDAANGKCTIGIPAAVTTKLGAGRYTDALRIVDGNSITSTLWEGQYYIGADPFIAPQPVVHKIREPSAGNVVRLRGVA